MLLFVSFSFLTIINTTLKGKVINAQSQEPIPWAAVKILDSDIGAYADSLGHFFIANPPQGEIELVASHIGYLPDTIMCNIVYDINPDLIFRLQPEAIPLPNIEVYSVPKLTSRVEPSYSLDSIDLRIMPANFGGDVLRSIAFIPGGGMSGDVWSGPPIIRNAATDENIIYYDGVELPWAWHLAGFNSIINTDFIDQSKVYVSAIPIRYDALSGVTLITSKKVTKSGGAFAYDVTGLRAAAWTKIKSLDVGTSIRKTFYHIKFGPLGSGYEPQYIDFALKSGLDINWSDRLTAGLLKSSDDFGDGHAEEISLYQIGYSRIGKIGFETNLSYTNHLLANSPGFIGAQIEYGHEVITDRTELSWNASEQLNCVIGEEVKIEKAGAPEADNKSAKSNSYVQCALGIFPNLIFDAGLRFSSQNWTEGLNLAPRINIDWQIQESVTLIGGYLDSYQHPFRLLRSSFFRNPNIPIKNILDTLKPGDAVLLSKRVQQYSFSVQIKPRFPIDFKAEAYYRKLSNLPLLDSDSNWTSIGYGWGEGIELTALYGREKDFWCELLYTLSKTERLESDYSQICPGEYDRRHVLSLRFNWRFPDGWTWSSMYNLATGLPYTPVIQDSSNSYRFGAPNSARALLYQRLDMKVVKEAPRLPLSPYVYIEVINLLNAQNFYMLQEYINSSGEPRTIYYGRVPLVFIAGIGGSF